MNNLQLRDLKKELAETLTVAQMQEVRQHLAAAMAQQATNNYLSGKLTPRSHVNNS